MLRTLLVGDDPKAFAGLLPALQVAGCNVIGSAGTARVLAQLVEGRRPELVIIATDSPLRDTLEQPVVMLGILPQRLVLGCAEDGAGVCLYAADSIAGDTLAAVASALLGHTMQPGRSQGAPLAAARARTADAARHTAPDGPGAC